MLDYPRVFLDQEELGKSDAWKQTKLQFADVLIVCGQGVYENGLYYGEFHDRDVYIAHALRGTLKKCVNRQAV